MLAGRFSRFPSHKQEYKMAQIFKLLAFSLIICSAVTASAAKLEGPELYSPSVRLNITQDIPLAVSLSNKIGPVLSGIYPFTNSELSEGHVTLKHKGDNRFILTLKDNSFSKKCQIPPVEIVIDRAVPKDSAIHGYGTLDANCQITLETNSQANFNIGIHRTYIDSFLYTGCEQYCPGFKKDDVSTEYSIYNHDISKKLEDARAGI